MERYTGKDAANAFDRLCRYLGKQPAKSATDVGGWRLDHNGVYGGYIVQEIVNEGGAVRHPLGDQRRNAREFYDAVHFLGEALRAKGIL